MSQQDDKRNVSSQRHGRASGENIRSQHGAGTSKKLRKKKEAKKRSQPFTIFLTTLLVIFITIIFGVGGALIGGYVAIINSIPDLGVVGIKPGSYTSYIYDKNQKEVSKLYGNENREYVTIDQIPEYMQEAVIAIEDERFYEHDGVDMKGFMRAIYSTLTKQQMQGGSTITQQLIKNNITKVTRNTPKTKIKEQYLALKYEKVLTDQLGSKEEAKKYIMELYLNTIGLGHGYNGVKVAAEGYFGKETKDLTLAECACLAGITNNPTLYSPRLHPENNTKRQKTILEYMLNQGFISEQEYNDALKEDVIAKVKATSEANADSGDSVIHSYYEDALIDQISQDLQSKYNISSKQASNIIYDGGIKIYSNLDPDIQAIVDKEFNDDENFPYVEYGMDVTYTVSTENSDTGEQTHKSFEELVTDKEAGDAWAAQQREEYLKTLTDKDTVIAEKTTYSPQPQAAMAIIDYHTGSIVAIGGGRGEKTVNRGFNRATDSTRQPGSVFKPLAAFAPAIDLGKINAATLIVDEPYTVDGYTPKNWWGNSYRGAVTSRTALRDSMNVVAVKVMVGTGVDVCFDYLQNFGFTTIENDNRPTTALGGLTNGVTQVEVAAAYGTLANQGQYIRPMFYDKVLDHDGNLLLENTKDATQVVKSSTGYIMTDLMTSVVTEGTGTAANFRDSDMPISGKTGTTTDTKDLTFVGYTPYYVGSIWFGYDKYNDKVSNMNGVDQSTHLRLWRTIMEQIHENLEVIDFPVPDTVEEATVCKYSGKQASSYCPSVTEYFEKGTPATEEWCDGSHSKYTAFGGGDIYFGYSSDDDNDYSYSSSSRRSYSSDDDNDYSSDDSDYSSDDSDNLADSGEAADDGGGEAQAPDTGGDSAGSDTGGGADTGGADTGGGADSAEE